MYNDISQEIYIISQVKGSCSNLPDQANLAYGDKVTINNSRVKQYIPAEVIDFYEEILQQPTTNKRELAEDFFIVSLVCLCSCLISVSYYKSFTNYRRFFLKFIVHNNVNFEKGTSHKYKMFNNIQIINRRSFILVIFGG